MCHFFETGSQKTLWHLLYTECLRHTQLTLAESSWMQSWDIETSKDQKVFLQTTVVICISYSSCNDGDDDLDDDSEGDDSVSEVSFEDDFEDQQASLWNQHGVKQPILLICGRALAHIGVLMILFAK